MRWRAVFFVAAALQASWLVLPGRTAAQSTSATKTLGDIGQVALPVGAGAIALVHHDGEGIGELALVSATTLAVVHTLKPIINRRRPNGGGQSFPSGHTASAFMGAAFFQRRYGWLCGAPAYAAAAFVGYSRAHTKEHWTTDVLAGAALGIASNVVFTHRFHKVRLSPTVARRGLGVFALVAW